MSTAEMTIHNNLDVRGEVFDAWLPKWDEAPSSCWEWTGYRMKNGYGRLFIAGLDFLAHRLALILATDDLLTDGLHVDHLCANRSCVNPEHLELVTPAENTRRGYAPNIGAAHQLAKTHCPQGHPYSEQNTFRVSRGERGCKTCRTAQGRAYRARKAQS